MRCRFHHACQARGGDALLSARQNPKPTFRRNLWPCRHACVSGSLIWTCSAAWPWSMASSKSAQGSVAPSDAACHRCTPTLSALACLPCRPCHLGAPSASGQLKVGTTPMTGCCSKMSGWLSGRCRGLSLHLGKACMQGPLSQDGCAADLWRCHTLQLLQPSMQRHHRAMREAMLLALLMAGP